MTNSEGRVSLQMAENAHIEISIKINPDYSDVAVQFLMDDFGCSGVITEEIHYEDERIISQEVDIVKGYFWNNPDNFLNENEIKNKIANKKNKLVLSGISEEKIGSWEVSLKVIPDEQWATAWKKHWHPQKIGSKIVICPSWEKYDLATDDILIHLDPGSAFGTGTHPTTRLCIMALEKYIKSGCNVADIGTGSGILAITALKLGASHVTGVDNDASVINVAKDNAQKNNVFSQTDFFHGSATNVKNQFDIVLANILHNIIADIMEDLVNLIKPNGLIILSGIIKEKEQFVLDSAIFHGLTHIETLEEDNWVGIILKKL
jgi:ribosomal protein L11 methyltransferase